MLRNFVQHVTRPVSSLNGQWKFTRGGGKRQPARYDETIYVPSAWESIPGMENYRGKAWFTRKFEAVAGTATRIVFGGVSHTAAVYVDGKAAGRHEDAFTPWDVVVPGLEPGTHELAIEVDNSFGPHSSLHIENDYYSYGGITRPVELQHVPETYIERLYAVTRREGGLWGMEVRVLLKNLSCKPRKRNIALEIPGCDAVGNKNVTIAPGMPSTVKFSFKGLKAAPWNEGQPNLYNLEASLFKAGKKIDDMTERIGFREIGISGDKLLVNGSQVFLRGFNRHEDHPQFGNALPLEAMAADLAIIRDTGCNTVRTCHYPNDMRFIDLCDETGIYVLEESHARTVDFEHPLFDRQIEQTTREMVDWHFNHPSIIIWGCLNECDSVSEKGRQVHERVLKTLKESDGSRPVTFASDKVGKDACLDIVDIVSVNLYPAWYGAGIEDIAPNLDSVLKWLRSPGAGARGKPLIITEFGAGAVYGERQRHRGKWSEEYQSDCIEESLRVYLNSPELSGAIIWQFCDCRVTPGFALQRPRTMNNKGIVDEHRRFKLAYNVVKKYFSKASAKDKTR